MSSTRSVTPNSPDREPRAEDKSIRQFVGFRLDGEDYAIAITKIQEIILMKPITRLPQVPAVDRRADQPPRDGDPDRQPPEALRPAARPFDDETRTIIVNVHDRTIGCIVDEVTQVMRIAADQIQPVPSSITAVAKQYIAGLARLEDRLLIILDIDKLFEPDELDLDPASSPQPVATASPTSATESGA